MIMSTSETLFRLSNLNKVQERISYQMSSTKKLQHGSDDANLFTRDIYLEDKMKVYEGIQKQIEKTNAQNNVSDSTMKEIKDLLAYTRDELIKANTSTTSQEARESIATNLRGVKQNLYMLVNEQVEGEYLYSGSNSMIQPFTKDANSGRIVYQGDGFLRRAAVEDGSYRNRGITGFENFMYAADTALKGGTLEFEKVERIVDQGSFEWKVERSLPATTAPGILSFQADEPLIDENGTEWRLNSGVTAIEDKNGNSIAVTGSGPYNIDMSTISIVPPTATPPTELSPAQLVKYDEEGNPTIETLALKIGTNKAYETVVPNIDGTKFEAKANTFDVFDKVINALEAKDSNGNPITRAVANNELKEGIKLMNEAYDASNSSHAKLGGRNKVFEISLERVKTKITQFDIMSKEAGAADLTKLAVESKALEVTYAALYSTINKMSQLSLVNFVK